MTDFKSKSILVVAATGGLAKETLKHLIKDGATNITITGRTLAKTNKVKGELEAVAKHPIRITALGGFDMLNPTKIKEAVAKIATSFDIVFLGAGGVFFTDDFEIKEWKKHQVEKTVFQNLFGSHIVIQSLKKNNLLSQNARIIIAGGEGARGIPGMIKSPEFNNRKELRDYILNTKSLKIKYNPMDAIGVSKLFGALWISKLASLEHKNLTAIWFTPGLTSGTNGLSGMPPIKQWFMKHIAFGLMNLIGKAQSPKKGARKFADCIQGRIGENGDILGAPKGQTLGEITDQKPMNKAFTNQELIDELWLILEELFGEF